MSFVMHPVTEKLDSISLIQTKWK